jgi:hypothetical protein
LEAKFAEKGPLGGSDIIETDFSDDAAVPPIVMDEGFQILRNPNSLVFLDGTTDATEVTSGLPGMSIYRHFQ